MRNVIVCSIILGSLAVILSGCGGGEIAEPVPLKPLVLFKAEVTKPSALYENSGMNEEDQFYFLEQGEIVDVLQVLYPGGPALVRTGDGEEGWCPDIAMKVELMANTFAAEALAARYTSGAFEETAPGIVGWVVADNTYFVAAAASADFTGAGKAETVIYEALSRGDDTKVKAYIVNPVSFKDIAETAGYTIGDKGAVIEWLPINNAGHTAISLSVWEEGSVETPLRLKEIETAYIWLYDGGMKKAIEIIIAENIVTIGAAAPNDVSKGDFTGRFYMQHRLDTEFVENDEGYYSIEATEKFNLFCHDEQLFEYEGTEPIIYKFDEKNGYTLTSGEFVSAHLTGTQTISEPARLRRQPADAGDPIRIIEAGEQVEIILSWPGLVETELGEGRWYYVYYQTKESEKEYAGWIFDRYFE
jgi:hypothetical protein